MILNNPIIQTTIDDVGNPIDIHYYIIDQIKRLNETLIQQMELQTKTISDKQCDWMVFSVCITTICSIIVGQLFKQDILWYIEHKWFIIPDDLNEKKSDVPTLALVVDEEDNESIKKQQV